MDQRELIAAVEALTTSVGQLSQRLDTQQGVIDELDRQRKGLHSTRIVMALMLVLIVCVGFLYYKVDANTQEVRAVQNRTSSEILCPLYEVLATSIKMNPPSPNLTAEQATLRQDAGGAILAGLGKLGCA